MDPLQKEVQYLTVEELKTWLRGQIMTKPERSTVLLKPVKLPSEKLLKSDSETTQQYSEVLALTLKETDTIWLMNISSGYSDLSVAKPLTNQPTQVLSAWKCLNADSQTAKSTEKFKHCETIQVKVANSFVNASAWDLYDTYAQVGLGIKEFQVLIDTALKTRGVGQAQPGFASEVTGMPAEKQMKRLIKQDQFQYCVLVMERLLASKTFEKKQRLLKGQNTGKYDTVPSSTFSYQVSLLWTYDNHFRDPMAVTSLDWNPENDILLAVGYGSADFYNGDRGFICIWSPKNPCHPERKIALEYSVTTVCFSRDKSNILAAGCRNGHILLIDIAFTEPMIRFFPRYGVSIRYGSIWKVEWFTEKTANGTQEQLLALGDSGCLSCYSFPKFEDSHDILSLDYTIRIEQETERKGVNKQVFTAKSLSGLSFSLVPHRNMCYVASKEGVVVKCKIQDPCRKIWHISAHLGPVYVVQNSPVCSRIFLTCGSDHFLKIWIDDIPEPLLTLTSNLQRAMVCAEWSPIVPTMIASVSTTELIIWDIARKPTQPITTLTVRSVDLAFSTLKFFPNGTGVAVGDQQGHVKVYQLSELPRPPYLKTEALITAIRNFLCTKPGLLHKFDKLLHFTEGEETSTYLG